MNDTYVWRKSSYSGGQGECVEVSVAPGEVAIRDTKNRAAAQLSVQAPGWHTFVIGLKRHSG